VIIFQGHWEEDTAEFYVIPQGPRKIVGKKRGWGGEGVHHAGVFIDRERKDWVPGWKTLYPMTVKAG